MLNTRAYCTTAIFIDTIGTTVLLFIENTATVRQPHPLLGVPPGDSLQVHCSAYRICGQPLARSVVRVVPFLLEGLASRRVAQAVQVDGFLPDPFVGRRRFDGCRGFRHSPVRHHGDGLGGALGETVLAPLRAATCQTSATDKFCVSGGTLSRTPYLVTQRWPARSLITTNQTAQTHPAKESFGGTPLYCSTALLLYCRAWARRSGRGKGRGNPPC